MQIVRCNGKLTLSLVLITYVVLCVKGLRKATSSRYNISCTSNLVFSMNTLLYSK